MSAKVVFTPGAAGRVWKATKNVEATYGEVGQRRNLPAMDSGGDDRLEMFDVVFNNATSVLVRGGLCTNILHGVCYDVSMLTDTGVSPDPSDTYEITIATSGWIYLALSDSTMASNSLNPNTLTANFSAGATIPSANDGTVLALAYVTFTAGAIVSIQRCHVGTWFRTLNTVDNASLDYNETTFFMQWHEFDDAVSVGPGQVATGNNAGAPADLFGFKDVNDGDVQYTSLYDAIDSMEGNWSGIDISGADGDWDDITHATLPDLVAGDGTDDHSGTMDGSGNFSYITGRQRALESDYIAASNCFTADPVSGTSSILGDHSQLPSVNVDDRILYGANVNPLTREVSVNWADHHLMVDDGSGNNTTVDWYELVLSKAALSDNWNVSSTDDVTLGTPDTGAFSISGGCSVTSTVQANAYVLTDAYATNVWNSDEFQVAATGDISLTANGGDAILSDGANLVQITGGGINATCAGTLALSYGALSINGDAWEIVQLQNTTETDYVLRKTP